MDEEAPTKFTQQNNLIHYQNLQSRSNEQQDKFKQYKHLKYQTKIIPGFIESQNIPYIPQEGRSISAKVRNRRFKKLQQLRQNGFFDQQAIKLRHPLLFHLFVGQYDFVSEPCSTNSVNEQTSINLFSSFLEKHLVNIEYKDLLDQQMSAQVEKVLQIEKNINQDQIRQIKKMFSPNKSNKIKQGNSLITEQRMEIEPTKIEEIMDLSNKMKNHIPLQTQIDQVKGRNREPFGHTHLSSQHHYDVNSLSDPQTVAQNYEKLHNSTQLTQEQKALQQQNLIEYCEELFLQGKLTHLSSINYKEIDQTDEYDDFKELNQDSEQQYFDQVEEEFQGQNQNYYTGIQDY